MSNAAWKEHAYPLRRITIQLQGTRQSELTDIINQLDEVKAKLLERFTSGLGYWGAMEQKTRLRIQATSHVESDGLRSGRNSPR
jgi:hypothetical protein